jgi:hypothetical protein
MKTQNNDLMSNVQFEAARIVAEAQAKAEAMVKAAQDAEVTYTEIAKLEAKVLEYTNKIKALKATLPNFRGGNGGPSSGVKEGQPNVGVGTMVRSLIREGYGNNEVWEMVCKHYNNDRTTKGNISWYRQDMRSKGEAV